MGSIIGSAHKRPEYRYLKVKYFPFNGLLLQRWVECIRPLTAPAYWREHAWHKFVILCRSNLCAHVLNALYIRDLKYFVLFSIPVGIPMILIGTVCSIFVILFLLNIIVSKCSHEKSDKTLFKFSDCFRDHT